MLRNSTASSLKSITTKPQLKKPTACARIDLNREVILQIPVGNWTFVVGCGYDYEWERCGKGYFIVRIYLISSNSTSSCNLSIDVTKSIVSNAKSSSKRIKTQSFAIVSK